MSNFVSATVEYLDADTGKWFAVGWGMPPGTYDWMLEGRAEGTFRVIEQKTLDPPRNGLIVSVP